MAKSVSEAAKDKDHEQVSYRATSRCPGYYSECETQRSGSWHDGRNDHLRRGIRARDRGGDLFVAAYARPAAKAEFLARLASDHAAACDRLGQGSGTSDHAVCMSELMRLNVCPDQGF